MALVDYTTFDEVRAALGVSDDELEDTTLSLPVYEYNLKKELRDIQLGILSTFATVQQISEADRTEEQAQLFESVRLFSTYAVARHLCGSLSMFSPKEITDSKSSMVRFSDKTIEETVAQVSLTYQTYRAYVQQALEQIAQGSVAAPQRRRFLGVAGLSVDPVTGQ